MGSKPPRCLVSFRSFAALPPFRMSLRCVWSRRPELHQRLPGSNRALYCLSYRASVLGPTGGLEPPSPGYEAGALPVELYRRWLRGQASNLQALAGAGLTTRCVCLFRHHGSLLQSFPFVSGTGGRIRTCGLRLRRAALCPLSYADVWYRGWDSNPHCSVSETEASAVGLPRYV